MTPYTLNINKARFRQLRKAVSIIILVAFISTTVKSPAYAQVASPAVMPFMSQPGVMVHLSPEFTPAYLKGIVIHPENALKFDFIIYKGDKELTASEKKDEYLKLTKYFLASLAIPDDDQWVNLSPYEKDRIIKDDFGKTEMGRDLLAQDYMLKQITASLIYPESNLGKKFWDRVYTQAQAQYGTTSIPVNTFNKVWILPDDAEIYEKGNTAYVFKSHLKVMMEEDYLSLKKHSGIQSAPMDNRTHTIASKIVKEIVLPALEKEVNEGENFATLRQMFSGMVLATWYKQALKESLLSKIYADKAKVKGVDQNPQNNEQIYRQYLKAYKKGVFNFIKEDVDKYTNETIPRKYFSGGFSKAMLAGVVAKGTFRGGPLAVLTLAQVGDIQSNLETLGILATESTGEAAAQEAQATPAIVTPTPASSPAMTAVDKVVVAETETALNSIKSNTRFETSTRFSGMVSAPLSSSEADELIQELKSPKSTAPGITIKLQEIRDKVWRKLVSKGWNGDEKTFRAGVEKALQNYSDAHRPGVAAPASRAMITEEVKRELEGITVGHPNVSVDSHSDKDSKGIPTGTMTTDYSIYPEGYNRELNPAYYTVRVVTGTVNVMNGDQNRLRITIKKQEGAGKEATTIYNGDQYYDSSDAEAIVKKANPANQKELEELKELDNELLWKWAAVMVNSSPDKDDQNAPTGNITTTYTIHLTGYARVSGNDRRYTIKVQSENGLRVISIIKWKVTESGSYQIASSNGYVDDYSHGLVDVESIIRKATNPAMTAPMGSANLKEVEQRQASKLEKDLNGDFGDILINGLRLLTPQLQGTPYDELNITWTDYINKEILKQYGITLFKPGQRIFFVNDNNRDFDYMLEGQPKETIVSKKDDGSYEIIPSNEMRFRSALAAYVNAKFNAAMTTEEGPTTTIEGNTPAVREEPAEKGGIDFNSANLNLQIKRDGRGVPLPISQQNLENIHLDGLIPVILDIRPAASTGILAELMSPAAGAGTTSG